MHVVLWHNRRWCEPVSRCCVVKLVWHSWHALRCRLKGNDATTAAAAAGAASAVLGAAVVESVTVREC